MQAAAGALDHLTGGTVVDVDTGSGRSVAGWLAQVQHAPPATAGPQLSTARRPRALPLVDGVVPALQRPQAVHAGV